MARPLRIEYPGAYYHVMNRGLSHRDVFLEDKGRETESVMSWCSGVPEYRRFVQSEIEEEINDFYKGRNQMPILGDKGFIQRVREMLGEKAKVEAAKPESRQVFGLRVEEIARA